MFIVRWPGEQNGEHIVRHAHKGSLLISPDGFFYWLFKWYNWEFTIFVFGWPGSHKDSHGTNNNGTLPQKDVCGQNHHFQVYHLPRTYLAKLYYFMVNSINCYCIPWILSWRTVSLGKLMRLRLFISTLAGRNIFKSFSFTQLMKWGPKREHCTQKNYLCRLHVLLKCQCSISWTR